MEPLLFGRAKVAIRLFRLQPHMSFDDSYAYFGADSCTKQTAWREIWHLRMMVRCLPLPVSNLWIIRQLSAT